MPMHFNYGQHLAVTITPIRQHRLAATVLWSVKQRHYDEIRAECDLDPHLPVGYGFTGEVGRAIAQSMDHARNVTNAADVLTARLARDKERGLSKGSPSTMGALDRYSNLILDDRAERTV